MSMLSAQSLERFTNQPNEGVEGTTSPQPSVVDSPESSRPPSFMLVQEGPDTLDLGYLDEIEQRSNSCKFCELVADSANIIMIHKEQGPPLLRRKGSAYRVKCYLEQRHIYTFYTQRGGLGTKRLRLTLSPFTPLLRSVELQPCFFPVPSIEDYWLQPIDGNKQARIKGSGRLMQEVANTLLFEKWIQQCESLHGDKCASPVWLLDAEMPSNLKVVDIRTCTFAMHL